MPRLLDHWLPFEPTTDSIFSGEHLHFISNHFVNRISSNFSWYLAIHHRCVHERDWNHFSILFYKIGFQLIYCIDEYSFLSSESDISEDTIESRISACIITSQDESNKFSWWMTHFMFDLFNFSISILNETDCSWFIITIGVVNISPNTFNVSRIINILNHIWVVVDWIASSEMIVSLSLPDCQCSISHSDIIIFFVLG